MTRRAHLNTPSSAASHCYAAHSGLHLSVDECRDLRAPNSRLKHGPTRMLWLKSARRKGDRAATLAPSPSRLAEAPTAQWTYAPIPDGVPETPFRPDAPTFAGQPRPRRIQPLRCGRRACLTWASTPAHEHRPIVRLRGVRPR